MKEANSLDDPVSGFVDGSATSCVGDISISVIFFFGLPFHEIILRDDEHPIAGFIKKIMATR